MSQDPLVTKSLALFHALVSSWANELRKDVTDIQDETVRKLDALQERMSMYEESIDEGRVEAFTQEITELVGASAPSAGEGADDKLAVVRRVMKTIDGGRSLQEVLTSLLEGLSELAPRVALFILKGGSCIGWNGRGFDESPGFSNDGVKRISVPASAATLFKAVVETRSSFVGDSNQHRDNVQLLSRIGNVLPSTLFASPLILRDRIAAVVYADSGDGPDVLNGTDAMDILTIYAAKVLDNLSSKPPEQAAQAAAPPPPAVAPTPAPPAPPAPASVVAEPEPAVSIEESAGSTVMFNASDLATPDVAPAAPAPAAAPAGAVDLDSLDAEAKKQHEDAMRFARLLVSEIKLYNEAKVQQGRDQKNLYDLLRDDIERSRQLYSERISTDIQQSTKYFDQELVRILADGDAAVLGRSL